MEESLLANETKGCPRHFFQRDRHQPDKRFAELFLSSRSRKGQIETSIETHLIGKRNPLDENDSNCSLLTTAFVSLRIIAPSYSLHYCRTLSKCSFEKAICID